MYQNINNFGYNRFFDDSRKRPKNGGIGGNTFAQAALDRLTVVANAVTAANPDLFSVVEVNSGQNGIALGNLVMELSSANLMDHLNTLGLASAGVARNYKLVPPIVTGTGGRAEGVAVFYDMNRLQFLGPWAWPGGQGPSDTAANITGGGGALAAYPANWTNAANPALDCLPNRVIPVGQHNAGHNENTLAAQWQFENPPGTVLEFPLVGYRRPILTMFREMAAPNRIIKLLSFHAPPDQLAPPPPPLAVVASILGTAGLANVTEMTGAIPANEVWAIVGDFNVSLFSAVAYGPLTTTPAPANRYTAAISRGAGPIPDTYPSKSYLITHIRTSDEAEPWQTNGYPGFGYMSVPDGFGRYDAIDNIFTRYGAAAGAPGAATILNAVSGSPYTAVAPPAPPPVIPTGAIALGTQLNSPASLNSPAGRVVNAPGAIKAFQGWNNYRKIRSSSDHMALAIDL
jgi:hypothetical protein